MKIGTYYYPEQWPQDQWERDLDNIAAMGLQIIHLGEFAWFSLEPSPGQFTFDWLADLIESAARRDLKVILCTPTAAPPIWLTEQHPEILPVNDNKRHIRHGGRRHYNPLAPAMRDATTRIVTALADRFGKHDAIIGWQIDNEYALPFDQSDLTHRAFQDWLRDKYQTLDALNTAWGTKFWNQQYTDFNQILFPQSAVTPDAQPHQRLDACRFWSWMFADFNKLQSGILRPRIGPKRFITTNFMPFCPDCDPADMAGDLDLMSWDSYPVGKVGAQTDEAYRMGDPDGIAIMHDQMAAYHDRWALMELQPGTINWSGLPTLLYPGAVRLWLWTAFAHAAEFTTTYRYRQPLFGGEMFHHGLVGTDGVTPSPGGRQFAQVIEEIERLDLSRIPALRDSIDPGRTVGLLLDFDQLAGFATNLQMDRWDQLRLLRMFHCAISRLGLDVRILLPGKPWPKNLPLVIAPGVQMIDDALVNQFERHVTDGGHLLLTCRTGLMNRNAQFFEGLTAAPILQLIGAQIEAYDALPAGNTGKIDFDGAEYDWNVWGDLLYAEEETKVLGRYADQFYEGAAVITQKKHGRGSCTYFGVYGEQPLIDAIVEKLATQAGLSMETLPSRVKLLRRGPYRILLNYQDKPVEAPAPKNTRFIIGTRKVDPAGVAVWEEE